MYSKEIYREIQYYKSLGLNRNQVCNEMDIGYTAVNRYWNMTEEDYDESYKSVHHRPPKSKCHKYEADILEALQEYIDITSAQIYRNLEEKYGSDLDISPRTLRNYVNQVREKHNLPRTKKPTRSKTIAKKKDDTGAESNVDTKPETNDEPNAALNIEANADLNVESSPDSNDEQDSVSSDNSSHETDDNTNALQDVEKESELDEDLNPNVKDEENTLF